MVPNGILSGQPGDDWQPRTLAVLAGVAAKDTRISDFQVHGSASGPQLPPTAGPILTC